METGALAGQGQSRSHARCPHQEGPASVSLSGHRARPMALVQPFPWDTKECGGGCPGSHPPSALAQRHVDGEGRSTGEGRRGGGCRTGLGLGHRGSRPTIRTSDSQATPPQGLTAEAHRDREALDRPQPQGSTLVFLRERVQIPPNPTLPWRKVSEWVARGPANGDLLPHLQRGPASCLPEGRRAGGRGSRPAPPSHSRPGQRPAQMAGPQQSPWGGPAGQCGRRLEPPPPHPAGNQLGAALTSERPLQAYVPNYVKLQLILIILP